jgi:hypothetical protein
VTCVCRPARAQAPRDTLRQAVTLSIGVFSEDRRDNADSPLAYAGSGLGERIDYVRSRAERRWYFSLEAGAATIIPRQFAAESGSEEGFGAYTLGAGTDWRLRGVSPRIGEFALGVQFAGTVTVARHFYDNQDLTEQTFDFAALTLAPAARWTRRLGPGALSASLALPLIAWVDHPYADVRFANQFVDFHYVPITRFRQADGVLAYDFNPGGQYAFTMAYRVDAMELDDLQPVRRFTQLFTVAVVRRFGPLP